MTGRTVDGTRGEDIQRAIDSLGSGGVVQLSAGTYQLSAALRLPSGVAVVGEGPARTRLELLPASNGHMFVNADPTAGDVGIELRRLSFDGNMAAQQRPREKALSDAFGAFFSNVREVTIADVHAFRICQSAFQFNDCSQVDVTGVRIREVGWGGIAASRSDDISIRDAVVESAALEGLHSAIHVGGGTRMRIEASVVGCAGNGIMLDSKFSPLADVTVDSTVRECLRGAAVIGSQECPITHVFITGEYSDNRECGVMVSNATNVSVVGATFRSNAEAGIVLQGRSGARRCRVADCVIAGSPTPIAELHGSRDNDISGNRIVDL